MWISLNARKTANSAGLGLWISRGWIVADAVDKRGVAYCP